jgi:CRISPR-associated protein Cas2
MRSGLTGDLSPPTALSGYRIMWIFVLFDLPVGTKKERKAATKFRHTLLDLGFEMSQFSVYLKFSASKEQAEVLERYVEAAMPPSGKVHVVQITDKQYENIRTYRGRKRDARPKIRINWLCSESEWKWIS